MHTFILRIYICGIQLQEQRYHISGIAVPVYWNSGAILAGIFIDRIAHDSYRINITSIDAEHDKSMREVYGLDKALRE